LAEDRKYICRTVQDPLAEDRKDICGTVQDPLAEDRKDIEQSRILWLKIGKI
jgi:hypothetical protein